MLRLSFLFPLLFIFAASHAQQYTLHFIDTKTDASFRALSVADENAVWVSGSKGRVGRSTNGGKDWTFKQVPGYETCDFRTLHAFDSNNAVIAHAGSPAYILRTKDGGNTWKQVYTNTDSAAFIDGVGFWDAKHGLMYGDPINGRMQLLYTKDGGNTWQERKGPVMGKGEASFAASGTNISCMKHRTVVIACGGMKSELFVSGKRGRHWRSIPTPMLAGTESVGIFSFMPTGNTGHWLIAGGDYKHDTVRTANFFYTLNKGKQWLAPATTIRGYRECLAQTGDAVFAVGPAGIDISTDGGANWKALSDEKGFHVIKPSSDNKHLFLAGSNGKLAVMGRTEYGLLNIKSNY